MPWRCPLGHLRYTWILFWLRSCSRTLAWKMFERCSNAGIKRWNGQWCLWKKWKIMGSLWPPDPTKRASLDLVSPRTCLKVSGHHMRGKISTRHWCWNPSHNLHVQFATPLRAFSKTVHQLSPTVDLDTANTASTQTFTKSRFNHFWTFLLRMSHLNVACTVAHSRTKRAQSTPVHHVSSFLSGVRAN